jgi:hypothetical protein
MTATASIAMRALKGEASVPQLPETEDSRPAQEAAALPVCIERRGGQRLRTVYRVARVLATGDEGLAKVLNISDEGMMLSLSLPADPGCGIVIYLSENCALGGRIAWREGDRCGVEFSDRIDSALMLKQLYHDRLSDAYRPLRLPFEKTIPLASEHGLQLVELRDISQAGLKIAHSGKFNPGLPVKVLLAGGIERRGIVRWSRGGFAGIALSEMLSVADLGSLQALSGSDG